MGIYIKGVDFYPATVSRQGELFRADFLDFPSCRAYGRTSVEVEVNARRALQAHVAVLRREGRPLPSPSVVNESARRRDRYLIYVERPDRVAASACEEADIRRAA